MNRNAGHLDKDWIAACRANEGPDSTLEDWMCVALNVDEIEIDQDGAVWSDGWLTQDECDELAAKIERGV